jgi:hypothetical protein
MKRRWTRRKNWRTDPVHPYHTLNLVFALGILGMLVYSAIYLPEPDQHLVPCVHSQVSGEPCPSCGLSRAFSALIRGDTAAARAFNPQAIPVFLFFIIQLLLRGLTSLAITTRLMPARRLVAIDAVFASLLFLWAFLPLLFPG